VQSDQRIYEALLFMMLKELKMAVAQYGATVPFTLGIIETVINEPLPPSDWKTIAKACLSRGECLFWKSEFQDLCLDQAERNRGTQHLYTDDQLTGKGQCGSVV
jgi:hypothetical protein